MKYLIELIAFWVICLWLFVSVFFFHWYAIVAWGIILFFITNYMARRL